MAMAASPFAESLTRSSGCSTSPVWSRRSQRSPAGRTRSPGCATEPLRRLLPILAATAVLVLGSGDAASTQGRIAIQGASSGTHLRLALSGGELVVTGPIEDTTAGCRFTRGHGVATCPLSGVGAIEVDTGPGEDRVEVMSKLPVPLTAYLGAGSDKLVGSGERDTCYPQGSDRNRCIGGGGNDICIAASVNTDCVGEAGDDYCEPNGGSDGGGGGAGEDVCYMGAGEAGCHGEGGDDRLYGGDAGDQLYGGNGF